MIIELQKIINLLDNTPNQPPKFKTKNWVKMNDDSQGTYNTNSQIKLKTSILKSSFCKHSNEYILDKGAIMVTIMAKKKVIFENWFYWLLKWNKQYTSR